MADLCDLADKEIVQAQKVAAYKSRRDTPDIEANGECHFCGETVGEKMRWCNASCRDDWEIINQ